MNKVKVLILSGGKSPEHEISLISGREVAKAIDKEKYDPIFVTVSKDGTKWIEESGKEIKIDEIPQIADIVFISMHGRFGEDGSIQGLLETIGVPYTGSGVLASAIGMNKSVFRRLVAQDGILSPKFMIFKKKDNLRLILSEFDFPLVIKPISEGSSVGVSIVKESKQLNGALKIAFDYGNEVMIDEYICGTEVSCGVLGNDNPFALPVVEIETDRDFFDYEAKYISKKTKETIPARIPSEITKVVQNTALKVYSSVNSRGFGRIDMIIKDNTPYVLEINTIPGLTQNSLLPKEAAAAGIGFPELIEKIIEFALNK